MTILVIDGQGGKLGKTLVENIKKSFPRLEIMAVGTNSAASDVMRRAGADRVASARPTKKTSASEVNINFLLRTQKKLMPPVTVQNHRSHQLKKAVSAVPWENLIPDCAV